MSSLFRTVFFASYVGIVSLSFGQNKSTQLRQLNASYLEVKNDSIPLAKTYILEALKLIDDVDDPSLKSMTFRNLADLYYQLRLLDSADHYIASAKVEAESVGDSLEIVNTLADMGLFSFHRNRYVAAQKYYLQALSIAERNEYDQKVEEINGRIGFLYTLEERFSDAYPYMINHYQSLKKNGGMDLVKATFNVSNLLKRMERYEEALAYLDTMKIQVDSMEFIYGQAKMYGMRAYVLMELKRLNEAAIAIHKAREIFTTLGIPAELFQMELAMANVEFERGDYIAMDQQMDKVASWLSAVEEDNELMLEYYDALYKSKKGIGDGFSALLALEQKTTLRDSIFNAESAKQRDELIEQYETAKKDQEIASMTQEATIQSLKLRSRNYQLVIGGVLAVLVIGFVVLAGRQKTAKNKLLIAEVEQKLLRLQMNPHFIFNTLGVIQSVLNKGENEKASLYLTRFSRLMRQTLEFSREEFIPLEEELELLKNYIEIQRISTGQSFDYELKIDDAIDPFEVTVPPMFAQPFIENVFLHAGLGDVSGGGRLMISFSKTDGVLLLSVSDNGKGMPEEQKQGSHKSLATQITRERLALLSRRFKTSLSFDIKSDTSGTTVQMTLPLIA